MTSFDLRQAKLHVGQEYRDAIDIELPPFEFGGERYLPVPETISAQLAITQAVTGTVFALAFTARLHGPCYRCLGDAVLDVPIRVREYQASTPDHDELRTPYVEGNVLEVSAWARDAVSLALPDKILCRADCSGLCPVCGINLNDEPHEHEEVTHDSRWEALEALRREL